MTRRLRDELTRRPSSSTRHSPACSLLRDLPSDVWQNVQIDIDLETDSYDLFLGIDGEPMELVAPYTKFRGSGLDVLDRMAVIFFRNVSYASGSAYLDNISIEVINKDWIGDANLDGEFNSADLVKVFQAAKYETGEVAAWSQGDWNADRIFDSSDLIAAFQDGGYEMGPKAAVAAVPEPSTVAMVMPLLVGLLTIARRRV